MANSTFAHRKLPPFSHIMLLLSAYTLVAWLKVSTAHTVPNGQPDQSSIIHSNTAVSSEERALGFGKLAVQGVQDLLHLASLRLNPNKSPYVDYLIHSKINVKVSNLYDTPEFIEVANDVINAHWTRAAAMKSLFDGLVRANHAAGLKDKTTFLVELASKISIIMAHPEKPNRTPIVSKRLGYDHDQHRSIVLGLKAPLFNDWRANGITTDKVYEMLKLDVTSSTFFMDPNVLLWIDFLAEHTHWIWGGPFPLVLSKFQKSFSDFTIATKVLAAGAETNADSVAARLMRALLSDWVMRDVKPNVLLLELVPSLEGGDVLNGPLKLWVKHFESRLYMRLYSTLLRLLLQRDEVPALPRLTSDMSIFPVPRNEAKELALADIIAAEWAKGLESQSGASKHYSVSPLAKPIFRELEEHWKNHKVSSADLRTFLHLDGNDNPQSLQDNRQILWQTFVDNKAEPNNLD